MTRWIALSALALVACDLPHPSNTYGRDTPAAEVWVGDAHPLAPAQRAWGLPLPAAYEVVEVPGVELEDPSLELCGPAESYAGGAVWGCAAGSQILLRAELTDAEKARTLVHEYGHALRGLDGVHLPESEACPADARGANVMCARTAAAEPTAEDFDFVLGH